MGEEEWREPEDANVIQVKPKQRIEIRSNINEEVSFDNLFEGRKNLWAVPRRLLGEVRDRLLPIVGRV